MSDDARLDPARVEVLTDADGLFEFTGVIEGEYLIRVRHQSYRDHQHPILVEGSGTAIIEISLSQFAIRLVPLESEAERVRKLEGRGSPAARNVITRDEIETVVNRCVDLESRTVSRRSQDPCGTWMMLGSAFAATVFPALGGSLAGWLTCTTDQSDSSDTPCSPPTLCSPRLTLWSP